MKSSNRNSQSLRTLSLKDALAQDNRWTVPDIDRRFLKPYHLIPKLSIEEQVKLQKETQRTEQANQEPDTLKQGISVHPNMKSKTSMVSINVSAPEISESQIGRAHSGEVSSGRSAKSKAAKAKLDEMLSDFKIKSNDDKPHVEHILLDDYLLIMQHLDSTRRFKRFFDPLRLKTFLIQPSQEVIQHEIESSDIHFLEGCRYYLRGDFNKATQSFQKVGNREEPFWYECQFNLATTRFKVADFLTAHTVFSKLMKEMTDGKLHFIGRDRRLYFNKALCELQMGKFDDCVRTCNNFLRPIKQLIQKESQAGRSDKHLEIRQSKEMFKLINFRKVRQSATEQETLTRPIAKTSSSILNHFEAIHPQYSWNETEEFEQELYRLKGFAYLRKQEYLSQDSDGKYKDSQFSHQCLVKAATNFQKAIGNEGQAIQKMIAQIKKKRQKRLQLQDEVVYLSKMRVTFINFKRKLEGGLTELEDENSSDSESSSIYSEHSVISRTSHVSHMSSASRASKASRAPVTMNQEMRKALKHDKAKLKRQHKKANNYEDLAEAIIGQREDKMKKFKKMLNQNIRGGEQNVLQLPGKNRSGSRTSSRFAFQKSVINFDKLDTKQKSQELQFFGEERKADTQRFNPFKANKDISTPSNQLSAIPVTFKSGEESGPPAILSPTEENYDPLSSFKKQVEEVQNFGQAVYQLNHSIDDEPSPKNLPQVSKLTNLVNSGIEKHRRFLDRFEKEGKQIAQEIKAPRRQIFTNPKLSLPHKQPKNHGKSTALTSLKEITAQLKRAVTQSTLAETTQISNPLLTSSKSLRNMASVADKADMVHWTEPTQTKLLRQELRKKQVFTERQTVHVFDQSQTPGPSHRKLLKPEVDQLPRVQSFQDITLNDKVKFSIQHAKHTRTQSTPANEEKVMPKLTQTQSEKQLHDAFQSYFQRTLPKGQRFAKNRQSPQPKPGIVIQSEDIGGLSAHKFTTEDQLKADAIEDQTRQIKVLNEVEKQIGLSQNQFSVTAQEMMGMTDKQRLKANKQIIDDFLFDSNIQETVVNEIKGYQQNEQNKTVTLDVVLNAQEEIEKCNSPRSEEGEPEHDQQHMIQRLNNEQLTATINGETQYLEKLRFFMQYPLKVRQQLIAIGTLEIDQWKKPGKVIFEQGGHSDYYYVIVKGTVQVEQIPVRFSEVRNMPPFVKRTCYDGDQVGELTQFKRNVSEFTNEAERSAKHVDELAIGLKTSQTTTGDGDNGTLVTENMKKDLTEHQVKILNAHPDTSTTIEPCVLLRISKDQSMAIINETLKSDFFVDKVDFLWKIDLFQGINKNHMLPLISNLIIKKFHKGQYIQREGKEPQGLTIIRRGQAVVCTEKRTMRRVDKKHLGNVDNDDSFQQQETNWMSNPKEMRELNSARVFPHKLERIDDEDKLIRKDMLIYRDILPFEQLHEGNYFGGRALLAISNLKNIKRQIQRQENMIGSAGVFDMLQKHMLKRVGKKLDQDINTMDQQQNPTTQDDIVQNVQTDITSMLSIVANSAKVEVWIIDEEILNLLPEKARVIVLNRLKQKQKVFVKSDKQKSAIQEKEQLRLDILKKAREARHQIKNQIKYSLTSNVVRKRMEGGFKDNHKYLEELERVLKQDIDKFPANKVELTGGHGEVKRFNMEQSVLPMPVKTVMEPIHITSICLCAACKLTKRVEVNTFEDPTHMKVADIELMQNLKDYLTNRKGRRQTDPLEGDFSPEKKARKQEEEDQKEEYGEPDRPHPQQVVNDIKKKFIEWEMYKMTVLKDIRGKNQRHKLRA